MTRKLGDHGRANITTKFKKLVGTPSIHQGPGESGCRAGLNSVVAVECEEGENKNQEEFQECSLD